MKKIICKKCGFVNESVKGVWSENNNAFKIICNDCNGYLKFVGKNTYEMIIASEKNVPEKKSVFCVVINDENILDEINRKNNLNFTNLQRSNEKCSPKYVSYLEGKKYGYKTGIQIIMCDDFSISKYLRLLKLLKTLKIGRNILNTFSCFHTSKFLNGQISALQIIIKIIKKFNNIDLTTLEI